MTVKSADLPSPLEAIAEPYQRNAVAVRAPSATTRWLLSVIAALPFLSLYVHHWMTTEGVPTGFLVGDMAYYSANGRAVFERGNGVCYPNPYDPNPDAPVLYFHWFIWLLGFGITRLGFDPGVQFVVLGIVAAIVCARLTLELVAAVLPTPRYLPGLFLMTMWGGGLLCAIPLYENVLNNNPPGYFLFRYDPFNGCWFLNWGRNLLFTTEAVYHSLVALCWLSLLRGRWWIGMAATAALAGTHPFSGFQLLLIVALWSVLDLVHQRGAAQAWLHTLSAFFLLAGFVGYYGLYLESIPQHRALRAAWSLDWTLRPLTLVLAYSIVGFFAGARLLLERRPFPRSVQFLLVCFATSFLLANHQWVVRPRQPLHFTRGYIWMPLALVGLPLIQQLVGFLRDHLPRSAWIGVLAAAGAVAVTDNAAFLIHTWATPEQGLVLTSADWDMLRWMNRHRLKGVFVSADLRFNYLSAVYTSLRPYYGHSYNTPDFEHRQSEVDGWFRSNRSGPWLQNVDYLLVPSSDVDRNLQRLARVDGRRWHIVYQNEELTLLGAQSTS